MSMRKRLAPEAATTPLLPAPAEDLVAVVVVPARDEEERVGACLDALLAQEPVEGSWEIVVVLDDCADGTADVVATAAAGSAWVPIHAVRGAGRGVGAARALGMELACARLYAVDAPDGLVATTDADSRVAPDWLAAQLGLVAAGGRAVAGSIDLDPTEAALLEPAAVADRNRRAETRLGLVRDRDAAAEHHHFAGASLAVTARVYRAVGGLPPVSALEDEAFGRLLAEHDVPIVRSLAVRVQTSARPDGRAERGLAVDLALAGWRRRRRYDAAAFDPAALREVKGGRSVAVVLPARNVVDTVGRIVEETVAPLAAAGLVDEVLVVDAASPDGTADVARAAGARVLQQDELLPAFGPALGKGDAMWRAVSATDADLVCFLDADTEDPHPHHLLGLLGPLLSEPGVAFVKGAFDRPMRTGDRLQEGQGGRVTELMARPLLNLHAPALAGFRQPLAGELGGRRDVLARIPFPVGYGVEIAMMLDVWRLVGLDAMAESWLGRRQNRHQSLQALSEMAYAVLVAAQRRVDPSTPLAGGYARPWDEEHPADVPVLERPPLIDLLRATPRKPSAPSETERPVEVVAG